MLERLEEDNGAILAWSTISTCKVLVFHSFGFHSHYLKGVFQSLHSSTSWVVSTLVEAYLKAGETESQIFILLRRLLTALMHHVSNLEAYESVSSIILNQFSATLERVRDKKLAVDAPELGRLMMLANVLIEVRKGGRVHGIRITLGSDTRTDSNLAKQLTALLVQLTSLQASKTSLSVTLGILTTTHFVTPSSAALNYFDHIFKSFASQPTPDQAEMHLLLSFLRSLVQLGYPQFKSIAPPCYQGAYLCI